MVWRRVKQRSSHRHWKKTRKQCISGIIVQDGIQIRLLTQIWRKAVKLRVPSLYLILKKYPPSLTKNLASGKFIFITCNRLITKFILFTKQNLQFWMNIAALKIRILFLFATYFFFWGIYSEIRDWIWNEFLLAFPVRYFFPDFSIW